MTFEPLPGASLGVLTRARRRQKDASADEARQPLTITVVLKRDRQQAFEQYLKSLYDPHSTNYRHFLSQREITERFGPNREEYDRALTYFGGAGFVLLEGSENRLTLTFRAGRSDVERAFHTTIADYELGSRSFYANATAPELPADLAPHVAAVEGLSDLAQPHHAWKAILKAFCSVLEGICKLANQSADPSEMTKCTDAAAQGNTYGSLTFCSGSSPSPTPGAFPHLNSTTTVKAASGWGGANGAGQTIGLVEFDTFNQSDVVNYLAYTNQSASLISQLSKVDVNGGIATPGSAESEVLLDVDIAMGVAPGAKTTVYDAPFSAGPGFEAIFNQMINDKVTVISNSWAYCEDETTLSDVQGIDTVLQAAAAAGISVFNGAGDSGSTCLDGAADTVAVPADSPHATAVGGSSENPGPSLTYGPETWWSDVATTPPAGQGGFGESVFFNAPSYQSGLTSGGRSVPDVVVNADPFHGIEICQADNGGCPSGLQYGGTSMAAPLWAAFTALLNQATGTNLGFLNPQLYALASSGAFHDASTLNSNFSQVGLGSPNLNELFLQLTGQTVGPVSATASSMALSLALPRSGILPSGIADDGTTSGNVAVWLRDAAGNSVAGKTVKLVANSGNQAQITPSSAVTTADNGAAIFTMTDATPENLTFTATDTTDGVTLSQQLPVSFTVASAASVGLDVFPSQVTADGVTNGVIVVTMQDALGRPTPGKTVQLTQTGGSSVISGPVPALTDSNGQIQFTAVDSNDETITYTAVDVTDGNLPFPQTGTISFTNAPIPGCSNAMTAAPGFIATPYVNGFPTQSFNFGNINFTCFGVYGMAFDTAGNLLATDGFDGNLYKFPPGGGTVGASTTVGNIGQSVGGLVFDKAGNLYVSRNSTGTDFTTGAVMQINPATGVVLQTVASNLTCPEALSLDPLSGDIFTDDACGGGGSNNPSLWRISGLPSTPSVSVYANLPNTTNANIGFAPSGNMYIWDLGQGAEVTGTSGPNPPVVTALQGIGQSNLGMLAFGNQSNGNANYLITNIAGNTNVTPNIPPTIAMFDLTANPPAVSTPIISNGGANNLIVGPDGCVYAGQGTTIWRITDSNGGCTYTGATPTVSLALTPSSFSGGAAQGNPISVTASFHNTTVAAGTPIVFTVSGANPQSQQVMTDSTGSATFTYTGALQGTDTIIATGNPGSGALTSNQSVVNWTGGAHVTFLTLNASQTNLNYDIPNTLTANLTDASLNPPVPLSGQSVTFSAGNSELCSGTTDGNGNAACSYTPTSTNSFSMSATYAGEQFVYNPSSDSRNVNVIAAPVNGSLRITPKKLNFGEVAIGLSKTKTVKVKNKGRITKRKTASPILLEMETTDNSVFTVVMSCDDDELEPKSKGVKPNTCDIQVTFTPTAAQKYTGNLNISDNLLPGLENAVAITGTGKAPK